MSLSSWTLHRKTRGHDRPGRVFMGRAWFLEGLTGVLIIELVSRTAGQTESEVAVPVARAEFAAGGNSGGVSAVAPSTATESPVGGVELQIEAPLPHISAHVINPELIGLFLSNRMRLSWGIIFRPSHSIQIIAPRVSVFF